MMKKKENNRLRLKHSTIYNKIRDKYEPQASHNTSKKNRKQARIHLGETTSELGSWIKL